MSPVRDDFQSPYSRNRHPSQLQHQHHHNDSFQASQPTDEPAGRIIFTRQLWQRNMHDGNQTEQSVFNKSQAPDNDCVAISSIAGSGRRSSSSVSSQRSQRQTSPGPSSAESKAPLTPEESPPFSRTRKRTPVIVEEEDRELAQGAEATSVQARQGSGDKGIHICICQPDPKIPRPRNAFILYRQHHQASVIAQHPGLANPEISKIIGEQWQNQPPEVKNKWKALAEEEKIRHQQQYPTYRYQPKRNARRNSTNSESGERPWCPKCGGGNIMVPLTPYSALHSNNTSPASGPQTPRSTITPITRTLPILGDLSLQSPTTRRVDKRYPSSMVSPNHQLDERDDLGPMGPDVKRRRFNGDLPSQITRSVPPRYVNALIGPPVQPGTPFPFGRPSTHPYSPGAANPRRESLPGLRSMGSPPGPMGPPPRPGPGYQQHRLLQGHVPHDRSLTLPPLQTSSAGKVASASSTTGSGKTAKDQVMNLDFRNKIHILRRVAPPTPVTKSALRGPLMAIEGDSSEAVEELGVWLVQTLQNGHNLDVTLLESPKLSAKGNKETLMAQCHRLAAEWLEKSSEIRESLTIPNVSLTDPIMVDSGCPPKPKKTGKEIDDNCDGSDDTSSTAKQTVKARSDDNITKSQLSYSEAEKMHVDNDIYRLASKGKEAATAPSKSSFGSRSSSAMPVSIVANYSLRTSDFFACSIPIDTHDPYARPDHWQWTATQWRGIIGPDLTIYARDAMDGDGGKQNVEISDEGNLFVVKRTKVDGKDALDIEPSTLRRLGFEVSEWVRAFGSPAEQGASRSS